MAHQCLACGHLFPEGSSAILQGCPQCKGTRFFYTRQALPEAERMAMAEKAQRDLREVVADILKASPASPASSELQAKVAGGLSSLRPSDLRELVKAAAAHASPTSSTSPKSTTAWPQTDVVPYVVHTRAEERRAELAAEMAKTGLGPDHPDTVNIRKPGQYDIDVAALLAHEPIVVHKDGAYHIHLASLFDSANKT